MYSVCKFDYYYNTTVTPSVLDGGSHILLANMLSPKRLFCSEDLHMADLVLSHPYVLVDHFYVIFILNLAWTSLLESLGSCSFSDKFTMHSSINAAFDHYMSQFGFSGSDNAGTPANSLLTKEYVFDILSKMKLPLLCHRKIIPGLFYLYNLLRLFSNYLKLFNQDPKSHPIHLFFHWWGIPVMKKPRKGLILLVHPCPHIIHNMLCPNMHVNPLRSTMPSNTRSCTI